MKQQHVCYMEGGSIINAFSGGIIERPAILVSKDEDIIHGWGNFEDVKAKFEKYACAYSKAGMTDDLNNLILIELSEYKISREMACYVIRRAAEFTATDFVRNLAGRLADGSDLVAWLKSEMERIPIDLDEKEWG